MILHSSAKSKGREMEKAVVNMIKEKGLDSRARRTSGSGSGLDKGDISTCLQILGRNANLEVKNQKVMSFESWWKQTEKQTLGLAEPVLVFKFHDEPMAAAKTVIYFETLLNLIKKAREPKINLTTNREEKFKVERAVEALKAVLKIYSD